MLYTHGKMQVSGPGQKCFTYSYHSLRTRRSCSVNYAYTADVMGEDWQSAKHIQFMDYAQNSRNCSIQCMPASSLSLSKAEGHKTSGSHQG